MYVSAPEAGVRDRLATIYNRVGTVKNGDRVEVLERQKRFVRVRMANKTEGWIEMRALVPQETFDSFQKLAEENRNTLVQGHGVTRVELNMHVAPGRETDTLYQLHEAAKVEMLRRAAAKRATPEEIAAKRAADVARIAGEQVKPAPKPSSKKRPAASPGKSSQAQTPEHQPEPPAAQNQAPAAAPSSAASKGKAPAEEPPAMDDWWLVRDQQGHTGWVLARMVDLDVPLDVVQYAEGQRIQAAFVLNNVEDSEKGQVAQYLVLLSDNHDGLPYDFDQVRVFTWNLKRHRYETAYRERNIVGFFPVPVSNEDFGKEGTMPVFTVRKQNEDGSFSERKYRLIGNIIRPVIAPGEEAQKAAHPGAEPKKAKKSLTVKKLRRAKHGKKL